MKYLITTLTSIITILCTNCVKTTTSSSRIGGSGTYNPHLDSTSQAGLSLKDRWKKEAKKEGSIYQDNTTGETIDYTRNRYNPNEKELKQRENNLSSQINSKFRLKDQKANGFKSGIRVSKNMVMSPYGKDLKVIVTNIEPGTIVICPYTYKKFKVPTY